MMRRLLIDFWSMLKMSATMRRADLSAVSPELIGAAITPRIAMTAPIGPSMLRVMLSTMMEAFDSSMPYLWKKRFAAAAQISATMPSTIIAP